MERRGVAVPRVSWHQRFQHWLDMLPQGNMLRDSQWLHRQRLITRFALAQALVLGVVAVFTERDPVSVAIALLVPGVPAAFGAVPEFTRTVRTLSTVCSLMFASAVLVDLTHGVIEAHFHFFVMLGVVSLYQNWAAFGLCVLITVVHHALMGLSAPGTVFINSYQQQSPLFWATIHGVAVLAASLTHMIAWKLNEQQELRDPLTQLPNRTSFNNALEQRAAEDGSLAVMFIDVDHFKSINDSGGHHVGDAALVHVAKAMGEAVRTGDMVARLGGDEFAILLRADAESALEVAFRIESALSNPAVIEGREVFVSTSIGVADDVLAETREPEALLRAADQAMYVAKSSGRGHAVVYSVAIDQTATQKARLAMDLSSALERGELHLHYQPIVDGTNAQMVGVEALLRWSHPELGSISPAEFIPLAEETGTIIPLGAWVLRESCLQVAQWQREVPACRNLTLSVNLSAQQLRDPDLLEHVAVALKDSGLRQEFLTLEVTETSMLLDLDVARRQLEAVRSLGVTVAIDDFGTGYSSLSYLARLPADKVKIDRSFIADLLGEQSSALALVQCILDMARALELDVFAEGVEEVEQQQLLDELGCRWSQGFLFAAPMPPEDLPHFAREGWSQGDLVPVGP
jgi:diguanylate cyclase